MLKFSDETDDVQWGPQSKIKPGTDRPAEPAQPNIGRVGNNLSMGGESDLGRLRRTGFSSDMFPSQSRGPNIPNNPSNASLYASPAELSRLRAAPPSPSSGKGQIRRTGTPAYNVEYGQRPNIDTSGYPDRNDPDSNYTPMGGSGSPAATASMIAPSPAKPAWSPEASLAMAAQLRSQMHLNQANRSRGTPEDRKRADAIHQSLAEAISSLNTETRFRNASKINPGPQFAKSSEEAQRNAAALKQQEIEILKSRQGGTGPMSPQDYRAESMNQGRMAIYGKTRQWPTGQYTDRFVEETGRNSPGMVAAVGRQLRGDIDSRIGANDALARAEQELAYINSPQYRADYDSGPRQDARGSAVAANNRLNSAFEKRGEEMSRIREQGTQDQFDQKALGRKMQQAELDQIEAKSTFYQSEAFKQRAAATAAKYAMEAGAKNGPVVAGAKADAAAAKEAWDVLGTSEKDLFEAVGPWEKQIKDLMGGTFRKDSVVTGTSLRGHAPLDVLRGYEVNAVETIAQMYQISPTTARRMAKIALSKLPSPNPKTGVYHYKDTLLGVNQDERKAFAERLGEIHDTLTAIANGTYEPQ